VIGAGRSPLLPDVPTLAESGFPNLQTEAWIGLVLPAGAVPEIVKIIHDAAFEAMRAPDLRKYLEDLGWDVVSGTPEAFAQGLRDEAADVGEIDTRARAAVGLALFGGIAKLR